MRGSSRTRRWPPSLRTAGCHRATARAEGKRRRLQSKGPACSRDPVISGQGIRSFPAGQGIRLFTVRGTGYFRSGVPVIYVQGIRSFFSQVDPVTSVQGIRYFTSDNTLGPNELWMFNIFMCPPRSPPVSVVAMKSAPVSSSSRAI